MEDNIGNVKVGVFSYGTSSTGLSIRAINNIIFADSYKSAFKVIQSIGRSLRLHKDKVKAHVFDLVDVLHPKFKNTLMKHFEVRKNDMYDKLEYPYDILKINL